MVDKIPILTRSSTGIFAYIGMPNVEPYKDFGPVISKSCRAMLFSKDGVYFAYNYGTATVVVNTADDWKSVATILTKRTYYLGFSPAGTYLLSWTPYVTNTADDSGDKDNLMVFRTEGGTLLKSFIQKSQINWEPKWSSDEQLLTHLFNGQIHFYENFEFKLMYKPAGHKIISYSISPYIGAYYIMCHIQSDSPSVPNVAKLFKYPNFDKEIAKQPSFRADKLDYYWNAKGNYALILSSTEVDTTGSSYYGQQQLYFLGINGFTSYVILDKAGPIHSVQWSPNNQEFCVIYGFMPARTTIFNTICQGVFRMGSEHRNTIHYNPHGNILLICGFGNLPGNIDIWDAKKRLKIGECIASDTYLEWASDGEHFITATTAPRLRIDNGFKVWHYTGSLLYEHMLPASEELYEAILKPFPKFTFDEPKISGEKVESITSKQPQVSAQAYRPPAARNRPSYDGSIHREKDYIAGPKTGPSKAAIKNKKKREARKAKHENEAQGAEANPRPVSDVQITLTGDYETDKRLKNIKKKLDAIEKLKMEQAAGKLLEINQLAKIKGEADLREELEKLTM